VFRETQYPLLVTILFAVGAVGMTIGWSLFFRMIVELNRTLPPNKKFSFWNYRMHFHEIKRLHEEAFPISALRTSWFALIYGSAVAIGASIIVAVKPK
jgi:hypothetical protein